MKFPLYNNDAQLKPCYFMGFGMLQNRNAVPFWSYFFENNKPSQILEIGTYEGGFAVAMAIMARNYGAMFVTFDLHKFFVNHHSDWFALLNVDFRQRDIFSKEGTEEIRGLISLPGKSIVLCDNGSKPQEFNLFSKFLKPGDVIAAHDLYLDGDHWKSSEVTHDMLAPAVMEASLQRVTSPPFDEAAWAVYEKTL